MAAIKPPTIILTGGSRGIGFACLKILLQSSSPANVVSLSRSFPPGLQELKRAHPDNLVVIQGDVRRDEDNKKAVDSAIKAFGSIDGLILNSAIIRFERLSQTATSSGLDSWREVFDVNFFSLVSILNHSLVHLAAASKARVVFISSNASVEGVASLGSYSASKAAMNSLCRTLASEQPSITSLALWPGIVDTEMQAQLRSEGKRNLDAALHSRFVDLFASSQLVRPEASAAVIANLVLQADHQLTGQFLRWDDPQLAAYRHPL